MIADLNEKEYTKIATRKCQDCDKHVSILCNESCQIEAIRCPDCLQTFWINAMEIEQLRAYLKKKGWKELPFGREEILKIQPPTHNFFILIPSRKGLLDYADVVKHALTTIAAYEDKSIDEVLMAVLNEEA